MKSVEFRRLIDHVDAERRCLQRERDVAKGEDGYKRRRNVEALKRDYRSGPCCLLGGFTGSNGVSRFLPSVIGSGAMLSVGSQVEVTRIRRRCTAKI